MSSLDLLRGLAAFAVIFPHFYMFSGSGSLLAESLASAAVEVFFVLSGFVLGPQILLYVDSRHAGTAFTFLCRRWMRTVPSYLVALAAISVVVSGAGIEDVLRYTTYTQNLFGQHNRLDYFPVAWSLSVEEWFYIVFPLVLLLGALAFRGDHPRNPVLITLGFIIMITALRAGLAGSDNWGEQVRRVVAFRIDSIAYGFLFFLVLRERNLPRDSRSRILSLIAVAGSVAAMAWCNWQIATADASLAKSLYPFLSAAFGTSVIAAFLVHEDLVSRLIGAPACEFLGAISYPVYLFHLVVFVLVHPFSGGVMVYFGATVILAAAFHYGIEAPILSMRPPYRPTRRPSEEIVA